jgi:phage terminase small subunit
VGCARFEPVHFENSCENTERMKKMNIKPSHLKKDSNPFRQKQNEQQKEKMKEQFKAVDLSRPQYFHLRNELIYHLLIANLEKLSLNIHLKEIDTFALVSIANTIDLLSEIERDLQETGTTTIGKDNQGNQKVVASPLVPMRNTTLNTLNQQLKNLQLDPASRQLLTSSVLNDVNMFEIDFDSIDNDEDIQSILSKAISGGR